MLLVVKAFIRTHMEHMPKLWLLVQRAHELPVYAAYFPFVIPQNETEYFVKQSASQLSLMPVLFLS